MEVAEMPVRRAAKILAYRLLERCQCTSAGVAPETHTTVAELSRTELRLSELKLPEKIDLFQRHSQLSENAERVDDAQYLKVPAGTQHC